MIFEPEMLDTIEQLDPKLFQGLVFRHMFGTFEPERENIRGARWNPRNTAAIYATLERKTCIAEADYYIGMQPLHPSADRKIYTVDVVIDSVIDLTDWAVMESLGIESTLFSHRDYKSSQIVGGAAAWLGINGILVPSARVESGTNLVIFPYNGGAEYSFEVVDVEDYSG